MRLPYATSDTFLAHSHSLDRPDPPELWLGYFSASFERCLTLNPCPSPARLEANQSGGVATMLVLEVVDGPWEGSRFEIGTEGCVMMRNPSGVSAIHHRNLGQVHIPDNDMSRKHAEISCGGGQPGEKAGEGGIEWRVRDLGSLNGTFVNGERLGEERKVGHPSIPEMPIMDSHSWDLSEIATRRR